MIHWEPIWPTAPKKVLEGEERGSERDALSNDSSFVIIADAFYPLRHNASIPKLKFIALLFLSLLNWRTKS